jgi:hypothetical protein
VRTPFLLRRKKGRALARASFFFSGREKTVIEGDLSLN